MLRFNQWLWLGYSLARRDLEQRYRGTALGFAWPFIYSGLLLGVFSVVFSVILRVRWGTEATGNAHANSALMIFAGLVPFLFFAEVLTRSPGCIAAVPNFVKKVKFPLLLLPVVAVASAFVIVAINTVILCLAIAATTRAIPLTALLLPLAFIPMIFLALGLSFFLSALGVFFRDLSQVMPLVAQLLMYLAPVCYPREIVPERFGQFVDLNPLTYFVTTVRTLVFEGFVPSGGQWLVQTLAALAFAAVGLGFFERTRRMFADLL